MAVIVSKVQLALLGVAIVEIEFGSWVTRGTHQVNIFAHIVGKHKHPPAPSGIPGSSPGMGFNRNEC
ncbi:MAG TPA: hypothetical protein ENH82_13695 [bacterium]|nr:hypothetical protein [bacterium]